MCVLGYFYYYHSCKDGVFLPFDCTGGGVVRMIGMWEYNSEKPHAEIQLKFPAIVSRSCYYFVRNLLVSRR